MRPISLLILMGDLGSVSKAKYLQWRTFVDPGFENTYFIVLNAFHVKNGTLVFDFLSSPQNQSYIATNFLGVA